MPEHTTLLPPRGRLLGVVLSALLLATALIAVTASRSDAAVDPCGTGGNKIACENSKPGSPASVWDIDGAGDSSIQGFSTDISVNVGSRVDLKIDTTASAYSITIFRTGYYGGDGARQIATVNPSATLPQRQPQCISDVTTELYDCGNWGVSASWTVPSTAVSGVYIALLKRTDNGDASHITFIVRDDSSRSDVVFQTSDPTWQAYNTYGGSDFYQGADNGRAYKISYNRPVLSRGASSGRDFYFANEYPMVRFLERNGYDVSYLAGVDSDRYGALLKNHKVFLSVGHDEYWSKAQRANVEAARDAGVNLQFLSGNEVYWKTRYEASADPSRTAYRTLVSYKETWSSEKIDPSDEWTGTWRDPRFAPPSKGGGVPENGLTGTMYMSNDTDLAIQVSAAEGKLRLWRGTTLTSMSSGVATLAPHTIGYESDEDLDNGSRPPGLIRLSTTTGASPQYLQDYGLNVAPGTTTHHLTLYRAASGALVFGAGTIQWTWGLDATHDSVYAPVPADVRMQQAQVNLLADMSAQPLTLAAGLVAATKSTDMTGPTTTITSPGAGATVANGAQVTVSGTATDAAGKVAGVEVSTDGGGSWHPATGTTSWSYTYVQHGTGPTPLMARAADDSANLGAAVSRSLAVTCPCSIFGATVPAVPATTDASGAELGLQFSPASDGFVTGIRFYKGTGNSGTHVGSLWNVTGQRLATATFSGESTTGWQTVAFAAPVAVTAGTTYVASYTAPNGRYAAQNNAFYAEGLDAPPLQVAGGFGAAPAAVYADPGRFPSSSFGSSNYYVDVTFTSSDNSALIATSQTPMPDSSSVPSGTAINAKLSKATSSAGASIKLTNAAGAGIAGVSSYNTTTRVVSFAPTSALPGGVRYTATITAAGADGAAITTGKAWSFTTATPPATPGVCPCTLFDDTTVPATAEDSDTAAVTLGVRFSATVAGSVTAVRFYKGVNNTGSHTGTLWSATGTKLATGTFTGESTSGWQTLTFSQPVVITKNTEYVASYRTTVGRYSATANAFGAGDLSRAPLVVTSSAGAYSYADAFPSASSSASYLVDLVFQRAPVQLSVVSQDPAPGASDVPRGTAIKVGFSDSIKPGASMAVTVQPAGTAVAGTAALDQTGTALTFTPSALLAADADIRVVLSGVQSTSGASLATQTWSFHTRATSTTNQSMFSDLVPQTAAATDAAAVELGTAFSPAKNGRVTAIRFYKGAGNTGTHVGSLWSSTGTRLATVTFTGESATGWQNATLSTPVAVIAGTTYVVSFLAPQGRYSFTSGFFGSAYTSGDLTAPAGNNGRYLYGASGGFPTSSFGSANYFVDVVYVPDAATITVTDRNPLPGATTVPRVVAPSVELSAPVANGYTMTLKQGATTVPGTATRSSDAKTLTFTPTSPLAADADHTVTVSGVTSTDGAVLATQTWTFHTENLAGRSLFTGLTPASAAVNDSAAVELGTVFTPSVDGRVTHVRFYKGAGNTGTHTGSIWSAAGVRLATVTFSGESSSGWQTAALTSPVALTAGTSYVVSYYAPNGRYSATSAFFAGDWTAGPLTAPGGANGRYVYGGGGGFPTGSYNATNYFVDVVFQPGT